MVNNVVLIAGGASVAQLDIYNIDMRTRDTLVVGVNDSMIHAKCDIGLTMDRLWLENRFKLVSEIASESFPYYELHVRKDICKNVSADWWPITTFECDYKSNHMSEDVKRLNGTNSGLCALNLAYQNATKKVYLLGYDMCKNDAKPYWYPPYDWPQAKPEGNTSNGKYNVWAQEFADVKKQFDAKGIEVINVTDRSKIECFRKMSFEEFKKELKIGKV